MAKDELEQKVLTQVARHHIECTLCDPNPKCRECTLKRVRTIINLVAADIQESLTQCAIKCDDYHSDGWKCGLIDILREFGVEEQDCRACPSEEAELP
jgi:hypothetical protein